MHTIRLAWRRLGSLCLAFCLSFTDARIMRRSRSVWGGMRWTRKMAPPKTYSSIVRDLVADSAANLQRNLSVARLLTTLVYLLPRRCPSFSPSRGRARTMLVDS